MLMDFVQLAPDICSQLLLVCQNLTACSHGPVLDGLDKVLKRATPAVDSSPFRKPFDEKKTI